MEKITLAAELTNDPANDTRNDADAGTDKEIRPLRDLEMVLVGGGSDPVVCW